MHQPTVSVIIPTYDRPGKLTRAVESVLSQSYRDIEIIVVNDHPDSDVCDVLPDIDVLRCIQHDENRGAPIARNTGILAAKGEYIAFIDDDDAWKPQKLERQIKRFNDLDDNFGLVYSGSDFIKPNNNVSTKIPTKEGDVYTDLLRRNFIPSNTPLIRKKCFSKVGLFDPGFKSSQDLDLWLRIADSYKVAAVPEPLAIAYKEEEDRISTHVDRQYHGQKRLLEKYRTSFKSNPSAFAWHKRQLGLFAIQSNRNREGVSHLATSFKYRKNFIILVYIFVGLLPNPVRSWVFDIRDGIINTGLF